MIDIIFPADPKGDYEIHSYYKFDGTDNTWKRPRGNDWEPTTDYRSEMLDIKEQLAIEMELTPNGPIEIPMGVMFAGPRRNFPVIGNFASHCTMAIFYQGERAVVVHKNPSMTWENVMRASGLNLARPITLYAEGVGVVRQEINYQLANSVSIQKLPVLQLINGGGFGRNSVFSVREQREYHRGEINGGIAEQIGGHEIGGGEIENGRIDMRGEIDGRLPGLGEMGGRIGEGGIGEGGIGEGGMGGRIR